MAIEGLQDKIQSLMNMGLDEHTAQAYLKAKNYDVDAAANAFYDGEDISKTATVANWQDDLFSADRDGQHDNLHSLTATAPPSRAPSRAGNHEGGKSNWQSREDADLAAAMQASQQDISPNARQQESGMVRRNGTEIKFGPATRDDYRPYEWAMTVPAQTADEVIPDVDVRRRSHISGQPRSLKHLADQEYFSNALTIFHSIPAVREAFLYRSLDQADYGNDPDWWRGNIISLPKVVSLIDGASVSQEMDSIDEILLETQRVMAFLDLSERSYMEPRALANTDLMSQLNPGEQRSKKPVDAFLRAWTKAANRRQLSVEDYSPLFFTRVYHYSSTNSSNNGVTTFDIPVEVAEGGKRELTELIDEILWTAEVDETNSSGAFVQSAGAVLVMRLIRMESTEQQLDTVVPPELYLDKYMYENLELTTQLRRQIGSVKTKMAKIDRAIERLSTKKTLANREGIPVKQIFNSTCDIFRAMPETSAEDSNVKPAGVVSLSPQEICQKLDDLSRRVDAKLAELADLKEVTRQSIAELSKGSVPGQNEMSRNHRYTLCGVATKPNVTYILRPEDEEVDTDTLLIEHDDDVTPEGMQWWRIDYEVSPLAYGAKITRTKTPGYEVLRAVELEHGSALLVYASDQAVDPRQRNNHVSQSLEAFVERDNQHFRDELLQARENSGRHRSDSALHVEDASIDMQIDLADIPRESIERGRRLSNDSTRVEEGSDGSQSPPQYGQMEFMDRTAFGLGYDVKTSSIAQSKPADPPTHEIHLEDEPLIDLDDQNGPNLDTEMGEKTHVPLIPQLQTSRPADTQMTDSVAKDDARFTSNNTAQH